MLIDITEDGNRFNLLKYSQKEKEELEKISTAKEYNYRTKKYREESYFYMFTFLPTGLFKRVLNLKKSGFIVDIKNFDRIIHNEINEEDLDEWINSKNYIFSPKWYQSKALYLWLKYNRMRVEIATGGGKSFLIAMYARYILEKEIPKGGQVFIVTIRQGLVDQMIDDIKEYESVKNFNDSGIPLSYQAVYAGTEKNELANVVVGTYHSFSKWEKEKFNRCCAIICDESHTGVINSIKEEIVPKVKPQFCKRFTGCSGTQPEEGSLKDLQLEVLFGPIGMTVSAAQLIEEGSIAKIEISMINIKYGLNISKKYFFDEEVQIGGPTKLRREREILHNLEIRNELIKSICTKFVGNQMILVESVDYAKFLANYLGTIEGKETFLIYGGVKKDNRNEIISLMKEDGDNYILIATMETMSTGTSIKNIMAVHFPDGGKSEIRVRQSCGRGLRLHPKKDYLRVFDYNDKFTKFFGTKAKNHEDSWPGPNSNIFNSHARERKKIYSQQKFPITETDINF